MLLLTTAVLWPGLYGPFLFDDHVNLLPLIQWMEGRTDTRSVVFGNESGPLGRPVAMFTFIVNAAITGTDAFGLKLGNLFLHLSCGVVLFMLLTRLAARDRTLPPAGRWAPLIVVTIWLAHPMMVGTVLYVVQRMAVLAALFMLLALLSYVVGRERLEKGRTRSGHALILLGMPLATVLAVLSKENGALAPLLCAILEAVYFRPSGGQPRPLVARTVLWLPWLGIAAATAWLLGPGHTTLTGSFGHLPYGASERLLTQGPILTDYLRGIALPSGPSFSLFRDDYPISRSIFNPPETIVSWLFLSLTATVAVALRSRLPSAAFGMLFFFAAHIVESSILPLRLYFEHRNYLPAIGVLWTLTALTINGQKALMASAPKAGAITAAGALALVFVVAIAGHQRAWVWQSRELLLEQTLANFPDSRMARLEIAYDALRQNPPNLNDALHHFERLASDPDLDVAATGHLGKVYAFCIAKREAPADVFATAMSTTPRFRDINLRLAVEFNATAQKSLACRGFDERMFAEWLSRNSPAPALRHWVLDYIEAEFYLRSGTPFAAQDAAKRSWRNGQGPTAAAILLAEILAISGDPAEAERLLEALEASRPSDVQMAHSRIQQIRAIARQRAGSNDAP